MPWSQELEAYLDGKDPASYHYMDIAELAEWPEVPESLLKALEKHFPNVHPSLDGLRDPLRCAFHAGCIEVILHLRYIHKQQTDPDHVQDPGHA